MKVGDLVAGCAFISGLAISLAIRFDFETRVKQIGQPGA